MTILTEIKTTEKPDRLPAVRLLFSGKDFMKHSAKWLTEAGLIAALYVALTALSALCGLSSGLIQVRLSELLCVLPALIPAAIPGVTVGCLLANLIFGGTVYDVIFGTLATLIGAVGAYLLRRVPILTSLPTIVSNALVIPAVLILSGLGSWPLFPAYAGLIAAGEFVACGLIGTFLLYQLKKRTPNHK